MITRGNNLLAASGVALSLLFSLGKDSSPKTAFQQVILIFAIVAAVAAGFLVLIGARLVKTNTGMHNKTIVGAHITENVSSELWQLDYEKSVAIAYCDIKIEIADRHKKRGRILVIAQWCYFAFVVFLAALAFSFI